MQLPFSEYFIIEYRRHCAYYKASIKNRYDGIIIWHINGNVDTNGRYINKINYIKPVYKNGGFFDSYFSDSDIVYIMPDDMYIKDDIWSSTTSPSSDFYNGYKTGAYLKVAGMDDEKATVRVGFQDIDDIINKREPVVTLSEPSKTYLKKYSYPDNVNNVTVPFQVENFQNADDILRCVEIETTGDVRCSHFPIESSFNKTTGNGTIKLLSIKGNGTVRVRIKENAASNGDTLIKYSKASEWSSEITVDGTPPQIALNGDTEITIEQGEEYVESGAEVTDNFELQENSLVIDSSEVDVHTIGSYKVYYDATDKAGNQAKQVVRTVNVVKPTKYQITFANYDGTELQKSKVTIGGMPEYSGETPLKAQDECYSYTFSGWSPQLTAVSGEATYTAQYSAVPRVYNVTFNSNGGEVENPITEYTYGIGAKIPVPTRAGYTFNGWYEDEALTGAVITEISAADVGDKTYYAKWIPNIYTVTYDYNEATGDNSVKTKTVVYDSEYGTFPVPSKIGCIFDGWHTADNVKVTSETIVSIAENHTLRAQWADCPHTWDSGKVTKNATCTTTGTALFTCTVCADTKTEDIAMLPHTEVTDAEVKPTCTKAGKEEGSHCSVCGTVIKAQKVIPATGHNFEDSDWTITVNPSESVTGIAERICKNDNSHKDTVTLPVLTDTSVWTKTVKAEPSENTDGLMEYTSQYGNVTVVIPAIGHTHDWGEWKIIRNPTIEAMGTAERTCIKNNTHKETTAVPNLSDKIWSVGSYSAPTCTENGSQEYTSDDYGSVTVIIKATGHTVVTDEAVAAACETAGKTEGSHCSVCGEVITEQQVIPPTGHIKDSGTVTEAPTVDKTGIKEYKCTVCNKVIAREEIPKLDPPPEPTDRVEFTKRANGTVLADIIFEKTTPPKSEDIVLYIAYYKDNKLMRVEIPNVTEMSALFKIDEALKDCEIRTFVWDRNMKPLMEVQKIDL